MAKRRINWILVIVIVIGLGVLTVVAFGLRNWQLNRIGNEAVKVGLRAYENRSWEEAARNLGRYLTINSSNIQILLKYAEAQLNLRPVQRGSIQQAIGAYRTVLRIDKGNSVAAEKLISLYLQINIAAEAQLIAERYLQANENPAIRRMLAISLARQRKFKDAIIQLQSVIDKYPDQILAYETMGQLKERYPENFPSTAEYWFTEAVRKNPSSAEAFIVRAAFYLRNNEISKALTDLSEAEKMDLSDPFVCLRLASEFVNLHLFDKARSYLDKVQAKEPANQTLWQIRAKIALQTMSKEEMHNVAQVGLKELAAEPWDFMPRACELFIRCGEFNCAGDCLNKLKQKDIASTEVIFLQGLLAEAEKKDQKAIMFWRAAGQAGDKSERTLLPLARAYYRTGDNQSAILQLRTLIREQPNLLQGHLELARLLGQVGNWDEAAEQARIAAEIAPGYIEAVLLHIEAQMRLIANRQDNRDTEVLQKIEKQLTELENHSSGAFKVKLLQFQLALLRGELKKAEQILANLKTADSTGIEVAIAKVDLLVATHKVEEAMDKLRVLTEQFPQNIVPVKCMAVLLAKQHNRTDCKRVLENAMQRMENPLEKRELGLLLANFYEQWNESDKAYRFLVSLAQEMPEDIAIKRQLLKFSQIMEDPNHAQPLVNEIKAIEGENGWQWRYEQGRVWIASEDFKNKYPQIVTMLKENLAANPADQANLLLLAAAYKKAGESQLAVETYNQALNCSPNAVMPTVTAMCRRKNKESGEMFGSLCLPDPNNTKIFLVQIETLKNKQNWKMLSDKVNDWLNRYPDDTGTLVVVAGNLAATENNNARKIAEDLLCKVLVRDPNCLAAMGTLAILLQINGRYTELAKLYERILQIQPDAVVAFNNLAWIMCEEQGKYQKALELAQEGLKIASNYADLIDTRGVIYYRLGEYHKAAQDFARCLELYPSGSPFRAASYFHLARTMAALGQNDKAVDNLQKAMNLNAGAGCLSTVEVTEAQTLFRKLSKEQNYAPFTN